jgi:hypothetical protein
MSKNLEEKIFGQKISPKPKKGGSLQAPNPRQSGGNAW